MLIRNAVVVGLCALAIPGRADTTVWKQDDGSYLDLSMLIQVQGRIVRSEGAGTLPDSENIFFRRLRPAVSGSVDHDWFGIIEIDFSAGYDGQDLKTSVEDAYLEYMGFEANQQTSLKIGSIDTAFGRENLTSGKRLLVLEQTFNGIHWYGTPDMTMGAGVAHVTCSRKISSQIVAGMMSIRQEPDRIWFQSPQNQTSNNDNTGALVSGRVDFSPVGELRLLPKRPAELAFDPSDLHRTQSWRVLAGIGGFGWWNNNDNNQPTTACPAMNNNVCPNGLSDVDRVYGVEVSGSVQGYGFALNGEYQWIYGRLDDRSFDGGLYRNGKTDLNKLSVGAGYMIYTDKVEAVGSWSLLTATNFPSTWYSSRIGLNWFIRDHGLQLSAEGTWAPNALGTSGAHEDIGRVQAQLAW